MTDQKTTGFTLFSLFGDKSLADFMREEQQKSNFTAPASIANLQTKLNDKTCYLRERDHTLYYYFHTFGLSAKEKDELIVDMKNAGIKSATTHSSKTIVQDRKIPMIIFNANQVPQDLKLKMFEADTSVKLSDIEKLQTGGTVGEVNQAKWTMNGEYKIAAEADLKQEFDRHVKKYQKIPMPTQILPVLPPEGDLKLRPSIGNSDPQP